MFTKVNSVSANDHENCDVMSVLMSNSDVERDDLEQLVDKIATLFNHTPRALVSSVTTTRHVFWCPV